MMRNIKGLIYKPFNLLYMAFLFFVLFTVASWFLSFFRGLLVQTLGIPQEYFWAVVLLSLIGSYVNLPLAVLESENPVTYKEEVDAFGVTWMVPELEAGPRQTLVMINLGGGIIPALISL